MYIFIYIYFRNTPKAQVILQNPVEAGGGGTRKGKVPPNIALMFLHMMNPLRPRREKRKAYVKWPQDQNNHML